MKKQAVMKSIVVIIFFMAGNGFALPPCKSPSDWSNQKLKLLQPSYPSPRGYFLGGVPVRGTVVGALDPNLYAIFNNNPVTFACHADTRYPGDTVTLYTGKFKNSTFYDGMVFEVTGTVQYQIPGTMVCTESTKEACAKGVKKSCLVGEDWTRVNSAHYYCTNRQNTTWTCSGGKICRGGFYCYVGTSISNYPADCATAYTAEQSGGGGF